MGLAHGHTRRRWADFLLVAMMVLAFQASVALVPAVALPATKITVDPMPPVPFGGVAFVTGTVSFEQTPPVPPLVFVSRSEDASIWVPVSAVPIGLDGHFSVEISGLRRSNHVRLECAATEFSSASTHTVPVAVTARLSVPVVPLSVTAGWRFTSTGSLEPTHAAATTVSLYCYRYESGRWVNRLRVPAAVTAGSGVYKASLALPGAGVWRVRAVHEDADHALSVSAYSWRVTVGSAADAVIWNRDGIVTIPERMATRQNARQLIVATGAALGAHYGHLRFFEYRNGDWVQRLVVPCRFGKNGLADGLTRRTGSLTTPTGIWLMPAYVFGQHPAPPYGTRMPYRHISRRSYWSAEPNRTYNTWVESSRPVYGEHLIEYTTTYEWALSTGYNALPNQRVYGRGTAIFLHCYGRGLTAGCISVSSANMARIFRLLDPTKRRVFAIGTLRVGSRTSIYAY